MFDNQIYPLQINTVIENKLGNLNLTKYQNFPEFFVLYIMTDTLFIPEHALLDLFILFLGRVNTEIE